jgi:hypothetical protein
MIHDRDIRRAVNLLIRKHGADAELVAARRADEMLERGESRRTTGLAPNQAGDRRIPGRVRWGSRISAAPAALLAAVSVPLSP